MSDPSPVANGFKKGKTWLFDWLKVGFVPGQVLNWEWLLMRIFFSGVLIRHLFDADPFRYSSQPSPNGIANLIDLTWMAEDWAHPAFKVLTIFCVVLYVFGRGYVIALPLLALMSTLAGTIENSQGAFKHSHNLITLVLIIQAIVAAWPWVHRYRQGKALSFPGKLSMASYYLYYTQAMVAGAYVIAALSKFLNSKGLWVWNSPYIALDLVKSQRQAYYRYIDDPSLVESALAAEWVVNHPWFSRVGFGGAFFLEALALIALKNRPWAFFIGLSLIAMHRSIFYLMHLHFGYSELILLIFFCNIPYWMWRFGSRSKGLEPLKWERAQ